jgi:group I intron endonuclease
MYSVYKHTAPNGKVYIGITSADVKDRWKNGYGYYRNEHFFKAITKYGWDNIKHEVLYEGLSQEEAEKKEIELIAEYNSSDKTKGYNLTNGGECSGKHTEETKAKIKERIKGKSHPQTEETKEKIRQARLGVKHTDETKAKMRDAKLGKKMSAEARQAMSDARKNGNVWNAGKHHSEETRKKISQARTGTKLTAEARAKMSESRKGRRGRRGAENPNSKPILCVETNTVYPSAGEVQRSLGLFSTSIIQACKGKLKTCGGYHWRYFENQESVS